MTEKINQSSLKNAKFENMTAEQVIKKYEEVLNSREKQIYELSAEIGQINKKMQKMKAKFENSKEKNIKLKNILQKKEVLLKQELDNKELMFMQLTKKEKECDEIQKKIEDLKNKIAELALNEVQERDAAALPRLPVDRIFSVKGFGTVVTGTLLSGTLTQNEEIEIYPTGQKCIIKGLEVHGEKRGSAAAGQRTAVNISSIKKESLYRGCVIAPPDSMKATNLIDVNLSVLKNSLRTVQNRARLHLLTGTSEILCRAVLLETDELKQGESCLAQLILEKPIAV